MDFRKLGLTAGASVLATGLLAQAPRPFRSWPIPREDLELMPESERPFRRLVIGLEPIRTRYFMLPSTEMPDPKTKDPRVRRLRRQLYWLDFELTHGRLMSASPPHTRFFVALPDPELDPESAGTEEDVFREYLAVRAGWSQDKIASRVRFFRVPSPVVFIQDSAEVLGRDGKGRLVLGIGSDADAYYREPVVRLARLFPNDFVVKLIGAVNLGGVNTEGGDVALSWLPDGRVGLLVGRNRVLRWVEHRDGQILDGVPVDTKRIEEARSAFSKAFFGVETVIVGEEALRNPALASEKLFHADMVVNVVRNEAKEALAFVPTFRESPVDSITHVELAESVRVQVQTEYDLVAAQMTRRGYRVVRLPFADDPVRSPVNVSRFVDPATGRPFVMLGRYPYHFPLVRGGPIAQFQLQEAFDDLELKVVLWRKEPSAGRWEGVERSLGAVWKAMDVAAASENPEFDQLARIYRQNGIGVLPLPIYPTGAGGIHCLLLR